MSILNEPLLFSGVTIPNRIVFQPMEGCDCNTDGTPSELTVAKYVNAAKSGCGLIWMEATAVCPEGRTSKRQMWLTEENLPDFNALVANMRKITREKFGYDQFLILQLTHSGRQSITPIIAYRHPLYEKTRPVTDDNIATDEYLDTLPALYAKAAKLAVEAGFDGVDVKSCHGYLFQELLSAYERGGHYGGSFENRIRLFIDATRATKAAIPDNIALASRLGVSDMIPYPYGFATDKDGKIDLRESDMLITRLISEGVELINLTIGNPYYNPHINRPFRKGGYIPPESAECGLQRFREVEEHLKAKFPSLLLVASAVSYYTAGFQPSKNNYN